MGSESDDERPARPASPRSGSSSPRSSRRKSRSVGEKEGPSSSQSPRSSRSPRSRRRTIRSVQDSESSSSDPKADQRRSSLDAGTSTSKSSDGSSRREARRGKRPTVEVPDSSRPGEEVPSPRKSTQTPGRMSFPQVTTTTTSSVPGPPLASSGPEVSRHSSHSHVSVGSAIDDSTHSAVSNSSVRELRRSIEAQRLQVPPAFRVPPSPKGRGSSMITLDSDSHSNRGRRGLSSAGLVTVESSETDNSIRSVSGSKRPPSGRTSVTSSVDTLQSLRPRSRDRAGRRHSTEGVSHSYLEQAHTSALPVNLIQLDSAHDKSSVSTYNKLLESIVNSEHPETQRGLDVLATMEQNGVTPDETTWRLIDHCSQLREESEREDDEHDDIDDSERKTRTNMLFEDLEREPIRKVALYSSGTTAGIGSTDGREARRKKTWAMEQDLALMPPAFRSSILAMLRRKGYEGPLFDHEVVGRKSTSAVPRKPPPLVPRSSFESDPSFNEIVPSVADIKKKFILDERNDETIGVDYGAAKSSIRGGASADTLEGESFSRIFKEHGVVKYMRPDGHGKAARQKLASQKNGGDTEQDEVAGFAEALDSIDRSSGPPVYGKLLSSIARSSLPSKASLAGKVLKRMKDNAVVVDEKTKLLLAECLRIWELPREPKPHELEMQDVVVGQEEGPEDEFTTPTQIVKKKVRFAENNSFRFIRRRRSIGSNERWDDPLTPPKRVNEPVDLAPGRFSSGQQDNRPALPRRSNSMSSLLSASSHSAYSTDQSLSSSDSADSLFNDEPTIVDRLKLPFEDSPETKERKQPAQKSSLRGGRPPTGPPGNHVKSHDKPPRIRSSLEMPSAPVRSSSNDEAIFLSPSKPTLPNSLQDDVRSPLASIPPPPTDDPDSYRTPSPQRRTIKRRRSISGTERRSQYPLTPPRRVSAPLEIFIAQEALKAKVKAERAAAMKAGTPEKSEEVDIVKGVGSIKVAGDSSLSNPEVFKARNEEGQTTVDKSKPPPSPSPTKASRRDETRSSTSALANAVRKHKPTKVNHIRSQPSASQGNMKSTQVHDTESGQTLSPLGRHKERMSEHWKRMEFRDKLQMDGLDDDSDGDDTNAIQWNTYENKNVLEGTRLKPTVGGSGHERSSSSGVRRGPRATQRHFTASTSRPKTKPSEAPSWQRVLGSALDEGVDQRAIAAKSTPSRPVDNASSSEHGARTAFSRRKEDSEQGSDGKVRGSSQPRKSRAARRSSLPV